MCAEHGLELAAVTDAHGYYLGCVAARDLLTGARPQVHLTSVAIGGMATPFGVYLSDGSIQAGVGNLALVAGGAALAVCAIASTAIVQLLVTGIGAVSHHDYSYLTPEYSAPPGHLQLGIVSIGLRLVTSLVFLLLIRASRIAGYHAAEHQTVHAVEHGEPLVPEIVARMPRPHPRCGTNILAAGILFWNLTTLFKAIPGWDADTATVVAVIITLFTWRRFGAFLQLYFTTRPARQRELESGISAAASLMSKYRIAPPARARFMRRVWCSGLLQSMAGMLPTLMLLGYLLGGWLH
jgi:hypothetical protein